MDSSMLIEILLQAVTVMASGAALVWLLQALRLWRQRERETEPTVEQRIDRLTSALTEASRAIQQIESEMNERRHLAEELQRDVETYNRLKELNQQQIEAITQVVGEAATGEARRSFWYGVAVNFGFFLLGATVSIIVQLVIR